MFRGSQREVYIHTLTVLGTEAYDLFSAKLNELQQNQAKGIKRDILEYRISLAWGATGGYARAIEKMAKYIRDFAQGLEAGVVSRATTHLAEEVNNLPPMFSTGNLESLLEIWEREDPSFLSRMTIVNLMPEATYKGSVLIDSLTQGRMQVLYLPTVAPWHGSPLLHADANSQEPATEMCQTHGFGRQGI